MRTNVFCDIERQPELARNLDGNPPIVLHDDTDFDVMHTIDLLLVPPKDLTVLSENVFAYHATRQLMYACLLYLRDFEAEANRTMFRLGSLMAMAATPARSEIPVYSRRQKRPPLCSELDALFKALENSCPDAEAVMPYKMFKSFVGENVNAVVNGIRTIPGENDVFPIKVIATLDCSRDERRKISFADLVNLDGFLF